MEDVKPPQNLALPMQPLVSPLLARWLTEQGLADLQGAIANADRQDRWALDGDSGPIRRELADLSATLSKSLSIPVDGLAPERISCDLTYVLGYLRTSHSLHLLHLFNTHRPGVIDSLLPGVPGTRPPVAARESALLVNRILHLIRQHAVPMIFGSERSAEVVAAIGAVRKEQRIS
jgi:hypothetical protein